MSTKKAFCKIEEGPVIQGRGHTQGCWAEWRVPSGKPWYSHFTQRALGPGPDHLGHWSAWGQSELTGEESSQVESHERSGWLHVSAGDLGQEPHKCRLSCSFSRSSGVPLTKEHMMSMTKLCGDSTHNAYRFRANCSDILWMTDSQFRVSPVQTIKPLKHKPVSQMDLTWLPWEGHPVWDIIWGLV